jgi:HEAT repeat protein
MPQNKDLKRLVRDRMKLTGEAYTAALLAVVGPPEPATSPPMSTERRRARLAELVQLLASKDDRIEAIRELMGGVTATEMRSVELPEDTYQAIVDGLRDPRPPVRFWCVQLLDHVPDERAVHAVVPLLDDPVDRVRRNAVHALGCIACKPDAEVDLPPSLLERIAHLAQTDPSRKVRGEAAHALACRRGEVPVRRRPRR